MKYIVSCWADGYEDTTFYDYALAVEYYNKLKQQGFYVELIEEIE